MKLRIWSIPIHEAVKTRRYVNLLDFYVIRRRRRSLFPILCSQVVDLLHHFRTLNCSLLSTRTNNLLKSIKNVDFR